MGTFINDLVYFLLLSRFCVGRKTVFTLEKQKIILRSWILHYFSVSWWAKKVKKGQGWSSFTVLLVGRTNVDVKGWTNQDFSYLLYALTSAFIQCHRLFYLYFSFWYKFHSNINLKHFIVHCLLILNLSATKTRNIGTCCIKLSWNKELHEWLRKNLRNSWKFRLIYMHINIFNSDFWN